MSSWSWGGRDREPVQDRLSKPPVAIATGGLSCLAADPWRAIGWLMGSEQNILEESTHQESAHQESAAEQTASGAEILRAIEPARYPRGENHQEL